MLFQSFFLCIAVVSTNVVICYEILYEFYNFFGWLFYE